MVPKQFGAGQFSKVLARIRVLADTSDTKSLQPGILCQTKLGHHEHVGEPLRMTRTGRQRER